MAFCICLKLKMIKVIILGYLEQTNVNNFEVNFRGAYKNVFIKKISLRFSEKCLDYVGSIVLIKVYKLKIKNQTLYSECYDMNKVT